MSKFNITAAVSDAAAAALGMTPKAVKRTHEFENYSEYIEANTPGAGQLDDERRLALDPAPLISVAMVCRDESDAAVDAALMSLLAQTYSNWELCAACGLGRTGLERFNGLERMRLVLSDGSDAELIRLAEKQLRGAWLLMLAPGDRLAPDAMYSAAQSMLANRRADVIYMDEDVVCVNSDADDGGALEPDSAHSPIFKPDYGPDTLLSYHMTGKPFFVSRRAHERAGGFIGTSENDLWEYAIRASRAAREVVHIARIGLSSPASVRNGSADMADMRKRINRLLSDGRPVGCAFAGEVENTFRICYPRKKQPSVGIVIPFTGDAAMAARCIESVQQQSGSGCMRIFVPDDGGGSDEKKRYLRALRHCKAASLVEVDAAAPMPRILNECAKRAVSDVLIFLNGNAEVLTSGFTEPFAELTAKKDTGAVGGKLLDADGRLLSLGTVIGLGGWAGSPYAGTPDDMEDWLKCSFTSVQRNVTAVSGAFMAVGGGAFFDAGLFDETITGTGWDTELCVRLMRKGLHNCYTPFAAAKLYGRLPDYGKADSVNLTRCYDTYRQTLLSGDKFYNFNYDPAQFVPALAVTPYPPIMLNPNFTG